MHQRILLSPQKLTPSLSLSRSHVQLLSWPNKNGTNVYNRAYILRLRLLYRHQAIQSCFCDHATNLQLPLCTDVYMPGHRTSTPPLQSRI
jgi:hypothetical protein